MFKERLKRLLMMMSPERERGVEEPRGGQSYVSVLGK